MRRLKVRFRVRSLMLVVALVGAIAWSGYNAVRRFLERVAAKYERAANTPWLRVEADPPPPA